MELNAENVETIYKKCLASKSEAKDPSAILVEGVRATFAFDSKRIEKSKNDIKELLSQLPDEFKRSFPKGGGWSFLQACTTKDDVLWGEHTNVEQLMVLGIASKQASYMLPKLSWNLLPGGMPYFTVEDK